jgi:cell division protein FtsN
MYSLMNKTITRSTVINLAVAVTITVIIAQIETVSISQAQQMSAEEKKAFCNPSNPRLKFVNSTESKICGIPATPSPATNASNPSNSVTQPLPIPPNQ